MSRKADKGQQAEWPIQFSRAGACDYLLKTYEISITQGALAMHDARGSGPDRRVILNRTYYMRAALDKWVEEMGKRGARRRRSVAA